MTGPKKSFRIRSVVTAAGIVLAASLVCKDSSRALADPPDPEKVEQAVQRGIAYLKKNGPEGQGGRATIAALAMLKADLPVDTPEIKQILEKITAKVVKGKYTPTSAHEHGYESGLDAITLETADSVKYKPEIEAIARYLIGMQNKGGDWNYPNVTTGNGDTSITQYGILGLWAAARAGVKVPGDVWDSAAAWHLRTQMPNGGFVYHPNEGGNEVTIGMTTAATASLHVCRMYLFPTQDGKALKKSEPKVYRSSRRYGILDRIVPESGDVGDKTDKGPRATGYVPKASLAKIDEAIVKGLDWLTQNFTIRQANRFRLYYLYTLERLTALADLPLIGEHDWYAEGAEYLLEVQRPDGSWLAETGVLPDTAFSVLFLIRATNKMLERKTVPRRVGTGLLAGGRGLPDNLNALQVKDGKVGSRKAQGTIDELLAELENLQAPVESVQKAIVESVQLGDREALISQVDRLKTLARHSRPEVRRTALWGLGRSRDLRLVPLLIKALDDTDVDVVVEANNALCFLSRRADGVGMNPNPLDALDEEAAAEEKTAALNAWRADAVKRWRAWYLTVRPYDERHDLTEPKAK
ncbi:MAG: HEAT repeat domain-containing protein [Planctomycetaceae bacterium]|nr:HEAT repeat domain-containing protein [Planctomycetaceae bacterium]